MELRDRIVKELRLQGYSKSTIVSYTACAGVVQEYYQRPLSELTSEQVRDFLLYLLEVRRLASSTINVYAYALRFVFREVLGRESLWPKIPLRRRPRKLPQVLSREEVAAFLSQTRGIRERAMLSTLYATGVRVGELVRLRVTDIDSKRMVTRVAGGKGGEDRYTLLPKKLLELLRDYWRAMRPKHWLFPGQSNARPICKDTAQRAVGECRDRAGLKKPVTAHTLRHSFATHLLEDGYDIRVVQKLLGHKKLRSTLIYVHVSNRHLSTVRSPFESLCLEKPIPQPEPVPRS